MTTDSTKTEKMASGGSKAGPHLVVAAEREAGTVCSACRQDVVLGDRTAICRDCGAIHHEPCWWSGGGCRSYECSPGNVGAEGSSGAVLTVSSDELAAAQPLPVPSRFPDGGLAESERPQRRWNKVAVWSFAIALLGIPLFGLITGFVAMILGCIALVVHAAHRKGMGLAVAAIVIGLADILGWAAGLHYFLGGTHSFIALQEFAAPDLDSLDGLPEHLGRAMRANVLVESSAGGLLGRGIGSGVILRIQDGIALIVTNRHVIDHNYTDWADTAPEDLADLSTIRVQSVGQSDVPAKVEWVAPHGVDLAIVSAALDPDEVEEARWDREETPRIGEDVFAVGNPHGLGWTHSAGKLSQVRRRTQGLYSFRILQSTAALNPGNSGGGLYDAQGRLIGINTLTSDKRFGEGLGFSIAFPTLLDLVPQTFQLPACNPEAPRP